MAVDFEQIRLENVEGYGTGKGLTYLFQLYADRTHFLFELIQNAEDAGATTIQFDLRQKGLIVRNNGRPFDHADVKSICNIGESTGSEDITRIGRFGVGFKSVYAYTNHPEVHSADAHFRIDNYVMPYKVDEKDPGKDWGSLFFLPFDREDVPEEEAVDEIIEGLENLSGRTLLFLKKIENLTWITPEGDQRHLVRKEKRKDHGRQVILETQGDDQIQKEYWQLFSRSVTPPKNTEIKNKDAICVEAAFLLEMSASDKKIRIKNVGLSNLVVFFPTTKETPLGFLLQGPYRTNPSRENIPPHDKWNQKLIEESAKLIAVSLPLLRDMGLMSTDLLEALPIPYYDFDIDMMFKPIVESVKRVLFEKQLLPTYGEGFVAGKNALLARGTGLRPLFKRAQLKQLFEGDKPLQWLTEDISEGRTNDLYRFLKWRLRIDEVTPEDIANKVTPDFLLQQSDQWMTKFYAFLKTQPALWRAPSDESAGILRAMSIIRLENNAHVPPFKDDGLTPNVFLPPDSGSRGLVVKSSICADKKARAFLIELGISEPDRISVLLETMEKRYRKKLGNNLHSQNTKDIDDIVDIISSGTSDDKDRLKLGLQDIPFLRAVNAGNGSKKYMRPGCIYSYTLNVFFEGNEEIWITDTGFNDKTLQQLEFTGVKNDPVVCALPDSNRHVVISRYPGAHRRGLNGFDPGCDVEGLDYALEHINLRRSIYIWNNIAIKYKNQIQGYVESSPRKNYSGSRTEKHYSLMGNLLTQYSWLPNNNDEMDKPENLSLHDLPEEYIRDRPLAECLEMTLDEMADLAAQIGLDSQDIDILKSLKGLTPEARKDIYHQIRSGASRPLKPIFPERPSADPDRRREQLRKEARKAPRKKYVSRPRSVRKSAPEGDIETYLRHQYTNDNDELVCQICKEVMPFKKRNGAFYFEKIEIAADQVIEHEGYHLALCPVCAAKYQEYVKRDEGVLEAFLYSIDGSTDPEITVLLEGHHSSVRFTEKHLIDVQEIRIPENG